jgi:hypothetical protein
MGSQQILVSSVMNVDNDNAGRDPLVVGISPQIYVSTARPAPDRSGSASRL